MRKQNEKWRRRLPVGAEVGPGGVDFRVWAPVRRQLSVVLEDGASTPLKRERSGHFSGRVAGIGGGARYRFRLDGDDQLYPDPASRFQPDGPHGPSEVVDPSQFAWTDAGWKGVSLPQQVIYEMHVGTFTPEGTWAAAARAAAAARRPRRHRHRDDAGRRVPRPLRLGLRRRRPVRADAPLRHARTTSAASSTARTRSASASSSTSSTTTSGPDGNYLRAFSRDYFTDALRTTTGARRSTSTATDAGPVREFFIANAGYWIDEFHLDGLRLDATQSIHDCLGPSTSSPSSSPTRARGGRRARRSSWSRRTSRRTSRLVRPRRRMAATASTRLWNDDFHHSAIVALTGRAEAYYTDHLGTPQEFISAAKYGYLFQGQVYALAAAAARAAGARTCRRRASSSSSQNHDQVANSGARHRASTSCTSPGRCARHDRADAPAARHADALPGAGVRGRLALPLLRRPRPGARPRRSARGGAEFLAQFPSLTDEDDVGPSRRSRRPAHLRAAASSTGTSASRHREARGAAPRSPPRCAARTPTLRRRSGSAASTAPCSGSEAFVAALLRRAPATTGCCSSTSASIST